MNCMAPQKYISGFHLSGKATASREKSPSSQSHWSSVKSAEAMVRWQSVTPRMTKPEETLPRAVINLALPHLLNTAVNGMDCYQHLGKPIISERGITGRPTVYDSVLALCGPPTERGSDEYGMSEPSQKPFFKITRLWKTTKMFSKRGKQTQSTVNQTHGTRIYSNERGSRHPRP